MSDGHGSRTVETSLSLTLMLAALFLSNLPGSAHAEGMPTAESGQHRANADSWRISSTLSGVAGAYGASTTRDDFRSASLSVSADYLEDYGVTGGYTRLDIDFKNGIESTRQDEFFLSGRKFLTPDGIAGTLGLYLNGYYIDNNDKTGNTDEVVAISPMLSYLPSSKSYYLDMGLAYSDYQNDLQVYQTAPSVGFGFNEGADWLQFRGYFIHVSNTARAQGKRNTAALQAKLTHWFDPNNFLKLNSVTVGGMAGERIYAVDYDAASVYNLADVQRGSAALDLAWKFDQDMSVVFHAGHDLYENIVINDKYHSSVAVLSLTKGW